MRVSLRVRNNMSVRVGVRVRVRTRVRLRVTIQGLHQANSVGDKSGTRTHDHYQGERADTWLRELGWSERWVRMRVRERVCFASMTASV